MLRILFLVCLISLSSEVKASVNKAVLVKDGPSTIDMRNTSGTLMDLRNKVCEKFEKDVLAHKGIIEAHVVSAVALSPSDKEKLVSKLSSQLSKEVLLTEEVDATVIGGLKLEVEGYQIDNTISGKLRALRNAMID